MKRMTDNTMNKLIALKLDGALFVMGDPGADPGKKLFIFQKMK